MTEVRWADLKGDPSCGSIGKCVCYFCRLPMLGSCTRRIVASYLCPEAFAVTPMMQPTAALRASHHIQCVSNSLPVPFEPPAVGSSLQGAFGSLCFYWPGCST